ncbi:MAG: pyridoxal phosphate-dependent aminotransferase [Catenisphaera adipataccumulans]|jgi:histidinol-phosphate aminotransferase|uniref:pyridoxal phosphate-dependent aminotransferase n=1 Tax=Catenisphaera adipataccumulans TaxID=700500 RepID=UPI003D8CB61C
MSKKIQSYTAAKQEGILLNANESSENLDDDIIAEIQEAMPTIAFNRYPSETEHELEAAYAKAKGIDADQVMAGNGSDQMLGFLIGRYLGKGKTLYTYSLDFSMFDYYASTYEADVFKYEINEDGSFDIDDFIQTGKQRPVDLVVFSNPNNPTGHVLKVDEVKKIVEGFAPIPVIVDEAYMEFSSHSMLHEVENFENLFVTRTLSKAYQLAACRLGFLVTSKKKIPELRSSFVPYALNSVSREIGTIVLNHAERFEGKIAETKAERDQMYDAIKDFQSFRFYPSAANFIYGRCDHKPELLALFEQAGIVIRNYDSPAFRLSIGSSAENQMVLHVLEEYERRFGK